MRILNVTINYHSSALQTRVQQIHQLIENSALGYLQFTQVAPVSEMFELHPDRIRQDVLISETKPVTK